MRKSQLGFLSSSYSLPVCFSMVALKTTCSSCIFLLLPPTSYKMDASSLQCWTDTGDQLCQTLLDQSCAFLTTDGRQSHRAGPSLEELISLVSKHLWTPSMGRSPYCFLPPHEELGWNSQASGWPQQLSWWRDSFPMSHKICKYFPSSLCFSRTCPGGWWKRCTVKKPVLAPSVV